MELQVTVRAERDYGMSTILAFIISLGLIGAGVGWIVAGPNSALCIGIGIASIVVEALSVFTIIAGGGKRAAIPPDQCVEKGPLLMLWTAPPPGTRVPWIWGLLGLPRSGGALSLIHI